MSVIVETNYVSFDGDDSTVEFDFSFPLFADTDLVVTVTDEDSGVTTLVKDVDYTMVPTAGNNDWSSGGTITTTSTYTTTDIIRLQRTLPYSQLTVYEEGDAFPAKTHERALDRLTMLVQQVRNDSVDSLWEELEGITGYDSAEIQLLGHSASGVFKWYTAGLVE